MKQRFWGLLKISGLVLALALVILLNSGYAQLDSHSEILIPDILGYQTMKCDFHLHTVFSDGTVWPPVRVQEAWREGLDAISISDHLEYLPHKQDLVSDHNRSYEIARAAAEELGIILIRGCEITKPMPPGHFNAIFIEDANTIHQDDWRDAIKAANDQGAFVFWNHPGWKAQAPDGAKWLPEHSELFEKKLFQGIEIVNFYDYYPTVHQWALDKNLTMVGNSDSHNPTAYEYDFKKGEHRPMTLVFAEQPTAEAIKQALFGRRTAVYFEDKLIGEQKYLQPIFKAAVKIQNQEISIRGKGRASLQIHNNSDLTFELSAIKTLSELTFPERLTLPARKTTVLQLKGTADNVAESKNIKLPYQVENLLVEPGKGLPISLPVRVT
ncbi:MAG: Sb-PDE family phosphodiesterase, partial [bacterium]|nr:Sb-PDE family phosphodiesterase [bacterium]